MENKLPFYMAYPVPLLYNDDRNARRDYDYMKSIYPDTAKRVLPYMEEECDRMEYDGSMMYDEYPDRLPNRPIAFMITCNCFSRLYSSLFTKNVKFRFPRS